MVFHQGPVPAQQGHLWRARRFLRQVQGGEKPPAQLDAPLIFLHNKTGPEGPVGNELL